MARSKSGQTRRKHQIKLRHKRSYKKKQAAAKSQ